MPFGPLSSSFAVIRNTRSCEKPPDLGLTCSPLSSLSLTLPSTEPKWVCQGWRVKGQAEQRRYTWWKRPRWPISWPSDPQHKLHMLVFDKKGLCILLSDLSKESFSQLLCYYNTIIIIGHRAENKLHPYSESSFMLRMTFFSSSFFFFSFYIWMIFFFIWYL